MESSHKHNYLPALTFDGGNLDCGSGLLLLIRRNMDSINAGQLLEIISSETSVEEDLPAWCRLTGNELVSWTKNGSKRSFLVSKGPFVPDNLPSALTTGGANNWLSNLTVKPVFIPESLPAPIAVPPVAPLSVTVIGSWPRPAWLVRSLHDYLSGRLSEEEFQETADDAVRMCVEAQVQSGVDLISDGEQRRDNYSSFVGSRLDNCTLVPLVDLLPLVENPEKFKEEMNSLDVPADKVRHPAVFGKISRSKALTLHEFDFVRSICHQPVKIALPGPYLLTRTMWMECIADKAYRTREELAEDIVRVLQEEIHFLLAAGVSMVQLDEPVLTEVVFAHAPSAPKRTFMCGALSQRAETKDELHFALQLINRVVSDIPSERIALHVCRGNWSPDESLALSGSYEPLLPLFAQLNVGTLFLEYCTPRAGDLDLIRELPEHMRIGLGLVNPKFADVEAVDDVVRRAQRAIKLVGAERILLSPDCGFATFADNPVTSAHLAKAKLQVLHQTSSILKSMNC